MTWKLKVQVEERQPGSGVLNLVVPGEATFGEQRGSVSICTCDGHKRNRSFRSGMDMRNVSFLHPHPWGKLSWFAQPRAGSFLFDSDFCEGQFLPHQK